MKLNASAAELKDQAVTSPSERAETDKRILIIIVWFGAWPEWIRCFLESCRWNPTVDWLIIGDPPPLDDMPPNVRLLTTSFADFRNRVSSHLGIAPKWTAAYKVCDLRPCLGQIYAEEIAAYDYWGFGDLDVIYGDIRRFYTPEVLRHDLISTHETRVSGHLVLLRNTPRINEAFKSIPRWRTLLARAEHTGFDEGHFSRLFLPKWGRQKWRRLFVPTFLGGGHFEERFSTNIPPLTWVDGSADWPERWFWSEGHLTNSRTGDREFLYLHFSNWNSGRWNGGAPAWKGLERLVQIDDPRPGSFEISAAGFTP